MTLSFLYGVIAGVSLLGFLGIYRPLPGILVSIAISAIVYYWFATHAELRLIESIQKKAGVTFSPWLELLLIISGLLLLCLLVLVPVARWPYSYSGDWFVWDAGLYHFPKAIELFRSGSVWDLSIPYGEYPFGYESLLTFAISLTGNVNLFGLMHVIIILLLILSTWIIAKILTNLSPGLLLILIALMILSDYIFQTFNLWRIFTLDIYTVGKNDLLLTAAQLSLIVFALIPYKNNKDHWGLIGISLTSMIALGIKPNSIFLVGPLIVMKIWNYINYERNQEPLRPITWKDKKVWKTITVMLLLIIPGVLWGIRNLLTMGRLFSNDVMGLSDYSILANITNPYFYNYIPKNLILLIGCLITGIFICFYWRKDMRLATFIYFLLFLAFISTPVSGFFKSTEIPTQVSWRFAETLLVFAFIYILSLIARQIGSLIIIICRSTWMRIGFSLFVVVITGWLFISQADKLQWKADNEIILYDQYLKPVGTNGYRSAYDFIQRNVRNSVIWVENGLPFYVYGPGFTNTITRKTKPDYLLIIHTDWFGEGRVLLPSYLTESELQQNFKLIYGDEQGSVYKSNN